MTSKSAPELSRFFRHVTPDPCAETQRKLAAERDRCNAEMAYRLANLQMPEDIRSRARAWGMESFCEVLWCNAFQAGYREAVRDRSKD